MKGGMKYERMNTLMDNAQIPWYDFYPGVDVLLSQKGWELVGENDLHDYYRFRRTITSEYDVIVQAIVYCNLCP